MKTIILLLALISNEKNANVATSSAPEKLNGLHFVVTVDQNQINNNADVLTAINDTLTADSYSVFKTKNYILACRQMNRWNEKNIKTEVKAYFNGDEISMDDAYTFMNNKNTQEAKEYAELNRKRINEIVNMNKDVEMFYSVTVSTKNNQEILKNYTSEYVYSVKTIKETEFVSIGKFVTFDEVKEIYNELLASGATNVGITACELGQEIPVSNAVGKEQEYLEKLLVINE